MTVKAMKDQEIGAFDDQENKGEKYSYHPRMRSVNKKKLEGYVLHSQVLKIKEEDSHLGEDIGERILSCVAKDTKKGYYLINGRKDGAEGGYIEIRAREGGFLDVVLLSRPILPSSPLSKNNTPTVKALH